MEYSTISTETWKLLLPTDWAEIPDESRAQLYFEAPDASKGMYIQTWNFTKDTRTAKEILSGFREKEVSSLHRMEGRSWSIVRDEILEEQGRVRWTIDALDRDKSYRIVSVLIGDMPWIVRSSFHDYDCSDFDSSTEFFSPIIDSLEVHGEKA